MSIEKQKIYEDFKKNLEAVNGSCIITAKTHLGQAIAAVFAEEKLTSTCMLESSLLKDTKVLSTLETAGITVHLDHIRLHAETDKGGITEVDHGIAELGTVVQESDNVDSRIIATMCETYIGIIKGSKIVPTYDDMFDLLSNLPELPNYVGFITGPSRTADIECVGTVGVHGPIKVYIIIVEDE